MSDYDEAKWDEAIQFAAAELKVVEKRRRRLMFAINALRGCKESGQPWPVTQDEGCDAVAPEQTRKAKR